MDDKLITPHCVMTIASRFCRSFQRCLSSLSYLVFSLTLFSCQGDSTDRDVLVQAWGEPLILREMFESRLAQQDPKCQEATNAECMDLKRNLLLLMIEEALLDKYTERQKMALEQTEMVKAENLLLKEYEEAEEAVQGMGVDLAKWRSTLRDHLRIELLLNNILKDIVVDESETLRYFLDHRELFVQPREVRILQIVVARSEEAIEIMDKLKKGEDFKALAEKYSRGPEGESGGDLGFLGPGQLPPEIEEAAFSLKVGELSDAIPSPYGFHILRVKARREPKPLTYPEVRDRIRKKLLGEKVQRVYETWLEKQWAEAQIKILDRALQSVLKETEQRT